MKTNVKLRKGQFIYFKTETSERLEEIVKSSNNKSDGIVRTYYPKLRRNKEYSVKRVLEQISEGTAKVYEASQVKDGQIIQTQQG